MSIFGVYLVDKEKLGANDIRATMSQLGDDFELVGFSNDAGTAVREIIALRPDLVITEWELPKMTGISLMRAVKGAGVDCEFIVLTASYSHSSLREFFLNGGLDYWRKSIDTFNVEEITEKLARKLASNVSE